MKLWMSAEFEGDIDDQIRVASNHVEDEINKAIESKSYPVELKGWDCIIILMKDDPDFNEVIKYSKKKQDMDFRLKIDFEDFANATPLGQQQLIYQMLDHSLDLLVEKGVSSDGIKNLREDVLKVAEKNNWV